MTVEEIEHLGIYDRACVAAIDRMVHVRENEHIAKQSLALETRNKLKRICWMDVVI